LTADAALIPAASPPTTIRVRTSRSVCAPSHSYPGIIEKLANP
jgi:hypothetical protein